MPTGADTATVDTLTGGQHHGSAACCVTRNADATAVPAYEVSVR